MSEKIQTISQFDIIRIHSAELIKPYYALVTNFKPADKLYWYRMSIIPFVSTNPPSDIEWIVNEMHLQGETFTMQGVPIRLEIYKRLKDNSNLYNNDSEINVKQQVKQEVKKQYQRGIGHCDTCNKNTKMSKTDLGWVCNICNCTNDNLRRIK